MKWIKTWIHSTICVNFCTDFAVGAPYDGQFERGAVYIYHGSRNGVREKASQVIFAENVLPGHATTFGFSLSGGLDLDNNQYPDLIIGAYEADSAFFLRYDFHKKNELFSRDNTTKSICGVNK